jgi:hypothetical protein
MNSNIDAKIGRRGFSSRALPWPRVQFRWVRNYQSLLALAVRFAAGLKLRKMDARRIP